MSARSTSIRLTRRQALRFLGGTAMLPLLAACTQAAPAAPTAAAPPTAAKPAAAAATTAPAAAAPTAAAKPAAAASAVPAAAAPTTAPVTVASPVAAARSSADVAVEQAKKFSGETLTVTWEGGLQAQDPLLFSGPLWEKETGVKVKVVEMDDQFSKLTTEFLAGNTTFDALGNAAPPWIPDLVNIGALEPLDAYVTKYMNPADLNDYLADVKDMGLWNGKRYGLFDDGDHLLFYFRKDLFADPQIQSEFKAQYNKDLGTPKTFKTFQDFTDAAKFFTDRGKGQTFGAALPAGGTDWNWFQCWFRVNGGEFFDPQTMKPGINGPAGVKTLTDVMQAKQYAPQGSETWDAPSQFGSYLKGELAMTSFWPPLGRWAEGGERPTQLSFVPETSIAGKTSYAVLPGGWTEMATGYNMAVWSKSTKKDLAYWFIQWMTSPEISLQRVMLPYALRDPYRLTHINSTAYRNAWPNAGDYLDTLKDAANNRTLIDLLIPGGGQYSQAYSEASSAILGGKDIQESLNEAAVKWDAITDRIGRDKQKQNYASFLNLPNSTMKNAAH